MYGLTCLWMYVFSAVVALIELKGLLLSCASVLWIMSERGLVFAEAEMETETCIFLSGLFSAPQESRTGQFV